MKTLKISSLYLLACLNINAENKDTSSGFKDGRLSLSVDNDVFRGSDRDYTNGARITWTSGEENKLKDVSAINRGIDFFSADEESSNLFSAISGFDHSSVVKLQYGFAITQLIFTPESSERNPPPNERPYAAWAGLGFSLHASNEIVINSLAVNLGVVGPSARGKQTQNIVHDLIDTERFEGWDSQIPDEFTFNIHFNQRRRYSMLEDIYGTPFSLNGFTELGSSLGNFRVDASIGCHFQFGYNVPKDFIDPRLSLTSNSVSWASGEDKPDFSFYLIVGVKGSAVLHDITLDGPVFRNFDTGTKSESFVAEYYYGIGLRHKNVELSYVITNRSKEYDNQPESQEFGSIALRLKY